MLEVDAFCTRCHYNLHGQVVSVDDRLGFPIVRCPECGTFHPAGAGVTAATSWVRRFAAGLVMCWVGAVLTAVVAIVGGFCLLDDLCVEMFEYTIATTSAPNHWRFQMQLSNWHLPTTPEVSGLSVMVLISAGSLIGGLMVGTLCVTLLWHWKFSRYFDVLILPVFSAVIMLVAFYSRADFSLIRMQCAEHVLCQTAVQGVGIVIGIMVGRSVARGIIMAVIPPKLRQGLAFLWRVDGLSLP